MHMQLHKELNNKAYKENRLDIGNSVFELSLKIYVNSVHNCTHKYSELPNKQADLNK